MKTLLLSIVSYLSVLAAVAQQPVEDHTEESKVYVGASLTTIGYHIYYEEQKGTGAVRSGYFTPVSVVLGKKIGERGRVQFGVGYGGDKDNTEWIGGTAHNPVAFSASSRTNAILFPISGQFVFLRAFKRFPVYGTVSLIPAMGSTRTKEVENSKVISDTKDKGTNVFATAGIGFNYRISNKFEGYVEYLFFKTNMTGENSFHYDWNQFLPKSERIYRSFALGVNYNLNLRREK